MSLKGKYVEARDLCWLHFKQRKGHSESGEYAYLDAYAKNRSEKVEDGETYIKVRITEIVWKVDKFVFLINIVNKDGTECYPTQVDKPERLTLIGE